MAQYFFFVIFFYKLFLWTTRFLPYNNFSSAKLIFIFNPIIYIYLKYMNFLYK